LVIGRRPLYFCPVVSFFYLLFFPRLISYLDTWCSFSANLECRSEMCCTRLSGNTGRKKIAILAPSHNFVGLYLWTKACTDNRKKLVKHQYLLHMSC